MCDGEQREQGRRRKEVRSHGMLLLRRVLWSHENSLITCRLLDRRHHGRHRSHADSRHADSIACYSARSAINGSMRDARLAGRYPASAATAARTNIMPANVAGSVGVTPKSSRLIERAATQDAIVPIVIPTSERRRV